MRPLEFGWYLPTHGDTTVSNWWSDGANEIAFSRARCATNPLVLTSRIENI